MTAILDQDVFDDSIDDMEFVNNLLHEQGMDQELIDSILELDECDVPYFQE